MRDQPDRLHILVSFAYWSSAKAVELLATLPPEWNVMLDSGAFTNFTSGKEATTVEDYIRYCRTHEGRFWRVINLDRIGDPAASMRNLRTLQDAGVPALPVFQRGGTVDGLRELGAMGSPVCVGGISQNLAARAEQRYVAQVVAHARHMDIPLHLLGVGRAELQAFRPWSGDNSTWATASRFGVAYFFSRGRWVRVTTHWWRPKDGAYLKPKLGVTRFLREYDLEWDDLRPREAWGHDGVVNIAHARSWMRLARELARVGVRYVFACNPAGIPALVKAWELERRAWPTHDEEAA